MLGLTTAQRAHMDTLRKVCRVAFVGIDAADLPVVVRTDARDTRLYAIHRDGRGIDPGHPVRDLTDHEIENFNPLDMQFLARFPASLTNP